MKVTKQKQIKDTENKLFVIREKKGRKEQSR